MKDVCPMFYDMKFHNEANPQTQNIEATKFISEIVQVIHMRIKSQSISLEMII